MGNPLKDNYFGADACCSMQGVACSGSKVIEIDWNNKQLTGQIPPDIASLKNLKKLYETIRDI
jgi:hypothetical protein